MSVEQQQELHQQQDEHDRLGVAALQTLERLSDTHRQPSRCIISVAIA